jgi:hypothetical protein
MPARFATGSEGGRFGHGEWTAPEEPLSEVTPATAQERKLVRRLDPFADDLKPEGLG